MYQQSKKIRLWSTACRSLLVLLLVCLGLVMPSRTALADTSAELSDDGQDYGWLYRRGDYFYNMSTDGKVLFVHNGYVYCAEDNDVVSTGNMEHFPQQMRYPDGTLYYGIGIQQCLDAIVRSGHSWRTGYSRGYTEQFGNEYAQHCAVHDTWDPTSFTRLYLDRSLYYYWGLGRHDLEAAANDYGFAPYYTPYYELVYLDGFLAGFTNLTEVVGLEYLDTSEVLTMARMFEGCAKIEVLDLSSLDTSSCADFSGMFDGCVSLTELSFGDGWTQAAALEASSDSSSTLATFPLEMVCERDGELVHYDAGDVIPDGAATYRVYGRTMLQDTSVVLLKPDGSPFTEEEECVYEYSGEPIIPQVLITYGNATLAEGVDYELAYENNVAEGTAALYATGQGAYYGTISATFTIKDSGAYAYLYDDGLLYLKAGNGAPDTSIISSERPVTAVYRWFDASTEEPGSTVPWAEYASQITQVVVEDSFVEFEPTSLSGWFRGCTSLESLEGLEFVNCSQVTSASEMFRDCTALTTLDLSWLVAPQLADLDGFAWGCTSLNTVGGWENLDPASLRSVAGMFRDCVSLSQIDLTGLPTSQVTDFSDFLNGCSSLTTLALGSLDLTKADSTEGFLEGCTSLVTISTGEGWKNATKASARLTLPGNCNRTDPECVRMSAGKALPSGAYTYRLSDLAMQFCTVEVDKPSYICTGEPIEPEFVVKMGNLKLIEGRDYSVAFSDNEYPGEAKATITGEGVMSGGLVVPYRIEAETTEVGDRLFYTNEEAMYLFEVTETSEEGGEVDVELTQVNVLSDELETLALPTKCTINGTTITVTTVSSKLRGSFRNVTNVIVGSSVKKIGASAFSKTPKVRYLTIKSARLTSVTNCLKGSRITTVATRVALSAAKKKTYKTFFTSKAGKKVTYKYYGY